MAYSSIDIKKSNGNLNRPDLNEDNIAMMVLPEGTYAIAALEPEIVYSLKQAEAFGFSPANDEVYDMLHHEHIKEFFRENPNGELHLITTTGQTVAAMLGNSSTVGSLEPYLIAMNGKIKQIAILAEESVADWFVDNLITADLVTKTQGLVNRLAQKNIFLDTIFLEGMGFSMAPGDAPDMRAKNAPNVAVVLGKDLGVASIKVDFHNYAAIGTVLGSATKKAIHESFAWYKKENTITSNVDDRFLEVRISSNLTVADPYVNNDTNLKVLHDKGYVFPRQVPFLTGFYWNQSNNCVLVSDDYNSTELVQVINKAIRIVGATIAPHINETYDVTKEGRLTEIARRTLTAEIRGALETNMGDNISSIGTLLVDPTNDENNQPYPSLVTDPTLRVFLGLVPKGKTEQIIFQAGFQN